jgi:hypothetical protein
MLQRRHEQGDAMDGGKGGADDRQTSAGLIDHAD